jgi:hypothetical protein
LLTFTPANGTTAQTVTVTGVNDFVVDGNQNYSIILSPAVSADPNYNGVDPTDVSVTNLDIGNTGGPTVTSVSPNTGTTAGNNIVYITGTNFTSTGMTVSFGGTPAVFAYTSSTSITAVAPAHLAGVVDVIVTTPSGSSPNTSLDDYTYTGTSVAVVSGVSPSSGPVGTVVTVTGSGFLTATAVTVGGVSATFNIVSDTTLTVTIPATTPNGTVDIRVTNVGGTSANTSADNFTNTTGTAATTTITLYFRWTLVSWPGLNNITAYNAIHGIETGTANPNTNDVSAQVTAIWYWDGASQSYKGYFVGYDNVPGANDFTTLQHEISYWIAIAGPSTTQWTVLTGP